MVIGSYWYVWKKSFWRLNNAEIKKLAINMAARGISEVILPLENPMPKDLSDATINHKLNLFKSELKSNSKNQTISLIALLNPGTKALTDNTNLVQTSKRAWKLGFDTVQIDIEPVTSGDLRLVTLLEFIQKNKPADKKLSLASYMLTPTRQEAESFQKVDRLYWDIEYFKQLASHLDHLTVMNYDSGLKGEDYIKHTREQFKTYAEALKNSSIQWRMGLPAYKYGRHKNKNHSKEENLTAALSGLESALDSEECARNFGVNVWLFDESSPSDWTQINNLASKNLPQKESPIPPKSHK